MTALWPFSMWGMDVIGPINPKASNGHMFILVAIDYFTKWIEAITLMSVTAQAVARFLRRDVIARYRVPATIIMDNAKNLNNKRMARAFNAKVRPREFSPGDLVLRKVLHVAPDSRGKFSYKYDRPFVVKEIFSGGGVILSDMDGTENALPVNADAIKKYYRPKTSSRRPRQKLRNEWHDLKSRKGESWQKESINHFLARSKTSSRRPRQKLRNEWHDLKSRKGESWQKESINHFLARSKTSSRRPRQKLEDPRGAILPKHGGSRQKESIHASLSNAQVRSRTSRDAPRRRTHGCLTRQVYPGHSGPSRSFRSILVTFRSILVTFGSIPVIQVHPGHIQVHPGHIQVHPGHSGPSWSHSAPSDHSGPSGLNSGHSGPPGHSGSFGLIFIRSGPPGLNSGHSGPSDLNSGHSDPSSLNPGHSGSIRSKFRSFGSIQSKFRSFRSILVHAFGSIPVIQVYPGSRIRLYPGHSGLSWFIGIRVHPGFNFPHSVPIHPSKARATTGLSGPAPLTSRRPPKTDLQAPRDHQGHGTSSRRPVGTLRGSPKDVSMPISLKNPLKLQPIPTSSSNPCQGRNRPKSPKNHPVFRRKKNQVPWVTRVHAITFKGFLTTLTLPREEVVTVRGPINRAQPPGSTRFLPYFPLHFQACPGLVMFRSAHGHLDLLLRSPTSPTPHRAVAGTRVPTHFPRTAAAASSRVSQPVTLKPSLANLKAASPTLFLMQRG
ncbi:hypothetical protein CRG98_015183 [Punica granatum]|uniref:Integrase catalytic domain-containing protein n=1 Tax=Punica granatum TaxID=22663 RepID=A0A2I0K7A6_PUNGR|nr:hypothetical protein CRG98_015183 [Punica granatum]